LLRLLQLIFKLRKTPRLVFQAILFAVLSPLAASRTTANYFFTVTMALGPLPDGTVGWAMGVSVPFAPMVY